MSNGVACIENKGNVIFVPEVLRGKHIDKKTESKYVSYFAEVKLLEEVSIYHKCRDVDIHFPILY